MHPDFNALSGSEDTEPRPMCCARVGLDCETCVRQSARKVALLCTHLGEDQQTGVFFQLYRDRVCRTNVKRFRREYELLTDASKTESTPGAAPAASAASAG